MLELLLQTSSLSERVGWTLKPARESLRVIPCCILRANQPPGHSTRHPFFSTKAKKGKPKKTVLLASVTECAAVEEEKAKQLFLFQLASKSKTYVCSAESAQATEAWISSIRSVAFITSTATAPNVDPTQAPQYRPIYTEDHPVPPLQKAASEERSVNVLYSSSWAQYSNLTMLDGKLALELGMGGLVSCTVTASTIELKAAAGTGHGSGGRTMEWPISFLRRFGLEQGDFYFEGGRRCHSGRSNPTTPPP